MEQKEFSDYKFASISKQEEVRITELEHEINKQEKRDIILIAYQPKDIITADINDD